MDDSVRTNPEFAALSALLVKAHRETERVAPVLDRAAALMLRDRVWTGPTTADAFAAELEGRRADLRARLEALVDAIAEQQAGVPRTEAVDPRRG